MVRDYLKRTQHIHHKEVTANLHQDPSGETCIHLYLIMNQMCPYPCNRCLWLFQQALGPIHILCDATIKRHSHLIVSREISLLQVNRSNLLVVMLHCLYALNSSTMCDTKTYAATCKTQTILTIMIHSHLITAISDLSLTVTNSLTRT